MIARALVARKDRVFDDHAIAIEAAAQEFVGRAPEIEPESAVIEVAELLHHGAGETFLHGVLHLLGAGAGVFDAGVLAVRALRGRDGEVAADVADDAAGGAVEGEGDGAIRALTSRVFMILCCMIL